MDPTVPTAWTESLLRAPAPDGWFVKESITLLAPDGQANVIVSREPLAASITTEEYARIQGGLLAREFPAFAETSFGELPLDAGTALLRRFSWTPPDGVRVSQSQLYFVLPGIGFTATATTPETSFSRFALVFESILRSLQLGPRPA